MKIFIGITIGTALLLLFGLLLYFAKTRKRRVGNGTQVAQVSAKTNSQQALSPKELITTKKKELIAKSGRRLTPVTLAIRMIEKENKGMVGNVIKKWLDTK